MLNISERYSPGRKTVSQVYSSLSSSFWSSILFSSGKYLLQAKIIQFMFITNTNRLCLFAIVACLR